MFSLDIIIGTISLTGNLPNLHIGIMSPSASRIPTNRLTLHAPRGIATHKVVRLREGHQVQVTRNRMLEGRRRHRKVQTYFIPHVRRQAVNQPGSKSITCSDSIHYVGQLILRASKNLPTVEKARRPPIMAGTMALSQGNGLIFQVREGLTHLPTEGLVALKL